MPRYSLGVRTSGTASGAATAELRSASADRLFVREISIVMAAATASLFGLGRPSAIGVTPTSPVTGLAEDPGNPAGTGQIAVAWATAPTAPAGPNYLRRAGLGAAIGNGWIWQFGDNGLVVPISSSIVVFNLQLNGVADITFVWDE